MKSWPCIKAQAEPTALATALYFLEILIETQFNLASFVTLSLQAKILQAVQNHGNLLIFADIIIY